MVINVYSFSSGGVGSSLPLPSESEALSRSGHERCPQTGRGLFHPTRRCFHRELFQLDLFSKFVACCNPKSHKPRPFYSWSSRKLCCGPVRRVPLNLSIPSFGTISWQSNPRPRFVIARPGGKTNTKPCKKAQRPKTLSSKPKHPEPRSPAA